MKLILKFIKTTLLGGVFFLVPICVLAIILKKGLEIIDKLLQPILLRMPPEGFLGYGFHKISSLSLLIIIVVVISFLAGLMSKTKIANRIIGFIEDSLVQSKKIQQS